MAGKIIVGVAGFSYKEWEGVVYPAKLKSTERLAFLAEYLDLVEINTSFYGPVKPATARQWCKAVSGNGRFVFTAKLFRNFTHSPVAAVESTSAKTIRFAEQDVSDTKAGFDALAAERKLGAVLAQFPISFKATDENRAYVDVLARRFREYPLVLEVRHSSWNIPETLRWLTDLRVGLCNIDQPLIGRAIRPGAQATAPVGYIRLHGRNYQQWFAETTNARDRYDYLYSEKELGEWKDRAQDVAQKTETTYVATNNHNIGKSAINALELIHLLGARKVDVPPLLAEHYPEIADRIGRALPQAKAPA